MTSPHYVVKLIGGRYVPVLQESWPRMTRITYGGWGLLLMCFAARSRGGSRMILGVAGLSLALRGLCGYEWWSVLRSTWQAHDRNGKRSESPSYQNDFRGRAMQSPADLVDEQAMESFPASDPPAHSASAHS